MQYPDGGMVYMWSSRLKDTVGIYGIKMAQVVPELITQLRLLQDSPLIEFSIGVSNYHSVKGKVILTAVELSKARFAVPLVNSSL